jgi:ABC-type amino acid transport substrate-binding protein
MEFELYPYPTPEETLTVLRDDQIDAAIADVVSTYQFMREYGGVKIVGPPVTDDPYVIATRLKSPILQQRVNDAILELSATGYLDELRMRWF